MALLLLLKSQGGGGAQGVVGVHRASTFQLFGGAITPPPQAAVGAHRTSTLLLFGGTVSQEAAQGVTGAHRASALLLRAGTASLAPPPAVPGIQYQLIINAIEVQPLYGWEVTLALNAQTTFRFDVLSADGSYYPEQEQEVYLYEDGTLIFGGIIVETRRRLLEEGSSPLRTSVVAHDFKTLAQRRQDLNETIPAGSTLKQALQQLVPYFPDATLDPAQADGPVLNEMVLVDAKAEDALNNLSLFSGYMWDFTFDKKLRMRAPAAVPAPYDVTPATIPGVTEGAIEVEPSRTGYANRIIARTSTLRSETNDAAEQALRGIVSVVLAAADDADQIALDALVAAYKVRAVQQTTKVRYASPTIGLEPGQSQTIELPRLGVASATYLITEVRIRRSDGLARRHVMAVEGTSGLLRRAVDVYREWSGGGALKAGVAGGGGGGAATPVDFFLGGSGVDAVRSATATWVPASGGSPSHGQGAIHAQIDTDAIGTTAATIIARLRALDAGVTVQARLYDVSAGAAVAGVSAPITSTSWITVSWNVTLFAGAHVYELQLLPDTPDADVMGTARAYLDP